MAALLLRRLTLQTVKTENNCVTRLGTYALHRTAPALPSPRASVPTPSCPIHTDALGTVADAQDERKKKKKNDSDFSNIGRKIHERVIHVLDEAGNDLGHMHRADVIRLMNERDLRLVKRDSGAQPPQYQLLTGVQIHEERLRLRESEKAHPKPGRWPAAGSLSPWGPDQRLGPRDRGAAGSGEVHGLPAAAHTCLQLSLPFRPSSGLLSLMPRGLPLLLEAWVQ